MARMLEAAATDGELVRRYAAGEAAAFEELYRRHELKIWRYLERHVRNRATADELMQDVWFAVAREAHRYAPTARFTTWLYTIAHHRMIDFMRARRPVTSLEELGDGGRELIQSSVPEPHVALAAHEDLATFVAAIERLPDDQRAAFLLQAEGELSVAEIAAVMHSSFETTKSRLRYAREKLRGLLAEYA
jgi:RNA polymerase sigma factor (sigma-70 family)